jgi:hypothetical protein
MMAAELARVRATFDDFTSLERALGSLKGAEGVRDYEAFGPVNLGHLQHLMPSVPSNREGSGALGWMKAAMGALSDALLGIKGSAVRFHATVGAAIGLFTLFYLVCVLTSHIYKIVVGGKPPVSNVPYVVPGYEGTILFGAIGAFIAVLYYARLLRGFRTPADYDTRSSEDSFGVHVLCVPEFTLSTIELLKTAGAGEVNEY